MTPVGLQGDIFFGDTMLSVAPGRISNIAGAPPLEKLISYASEISHDLSDIACMTEADRRVSQATTERFHEAGFFRLMQPARFGGYEYGFTAFIDVISTLARGCTASAWSCGLGVVHQWLIANFPLQAQHDVWDENPDAIACGSYAPAATAQAVDGGYLVQGRWLFASNVDNSPWAILGVFFPPIEKGQPQQAGFVLAPRKDWRIEDDWHVAGQAGTGSKSVVIEQPVFVPEHRRLTFAEASSGASPGALAHANPIYRIPFLSAVPVCLVSPILGTAQGAVAAFVALCAERVTRGAVAGGGARLVEFFPVQSRLAEAAALVDAAQLLLNRDTAEVEHLARQGKSVSLKDRIRNRRDHAFAARMASNAVDALFTCVGGAGLALDQPLQRMWRDANAIVRHYSLNWDAVSSMVGQHMLGLEPKGQY